MKSSADVSSTMMKVDLSINHFLDRAGTLFPTNEIVSRRPDKTLVKHTYAQFYERTRSLAQGLKDLGLKKGDRVATLCWNHHAHLECYFGIPAAGGVMHTLNLRLSPDEIAWIANDAQDRFLIIDDILLPLYRQIEDKYKFEKVIVFPFSGAQVPAEFMDYESWLASTDGSHFEYAAHSEDDPVSMCYTSGTTGRPKGVVYSHRSTVLHTLVASLGDFWSLRGTDVVLPVTPMFHANSWGIPYGAVMMGVKMVFPGPHLHPDDLLDLMQVEPPTLSLGVPTIWMALIQHLEQNKLRFSTMRRTAAGGSAMPTALIAKFSDDYDVEVRHGWGMTETTAVATMSSMTPEQRAMPAADRHALVGKQGRSVFGVDIKVVDEEGNTMPRDGTSQGELMVRGQWIISGYYKGDKSPLVGGWFPTGDIATIDAQGVMQIRDRTKDVIKTGGEWISSIDLENAAIAHPAVAMAAVIGVKHPKWDERPLMFVVRKPGQAVEKEEILSFLEGRVAKWWVPDDVIFLESLPVGGTGKVQKGDLRKTYGGVFS